MEKSKQQHHVHQSSATHSLVGSPQLDRIEESLSKMIASEAVTDQINTVAEEITCVETENGPMTARTEANDVKTDTAGVDIYSYALLYKTYNLMPSQKF